MSHFGKWIVLSVVVALSAFLFFWYAYSALPVSSITFTIEKGDFTDKITEVGELSALESVTILAQKDGPIAYLKPEGSFIKPGDVLVRFDPSEFEVVLSARRVELQGAEAGLKGAEKKLEANQVTLLAQLAKLKSAVRVAEVDLKKLKRLPLSNDLEIARLRTERARIKFEHANKKLEVLPELVEKGFITRSALDDARTTYLAADGALQTAQLQFQKVADGARPEQMEKARIKLKQARSALEKAKSAMGPKRQILEAMVGVKQALVAKAKNSIEKAEAKLAKTIIRAPQAGLVVYAEATGGRILPGSGKVRLGMMAFAGQPLIYLPDISKMIADVEINEVDIRKVKVGGPAEVILLSYPDALFRGKVLKIGRLARLKRKTSPLRTTSKIKIFDVKVLIEGTDPRMKPGSTATVHFILDRLRDVITVPLLGIVPRGEEHFVFVIDTEQESSNNERPNSRTVDTMEGQNPQTSERRQGIKRKIYSLFGKVFSWKNRIKMEKRKVLLGPSNDHRVVVKQGLHVGDMITLMPRSSESEKNARPDF